MNQSLTQQTHLSPTETLPHTTNFTHSQLKVERYFSDEFPKYPVRSQLKSKGSQSAWKKERMNKTVYATKPIVINNYCDDMFAIEPDDYRYCAVKQKKRKQNQISHVMKPFFINLKAPNAKKLNPKLSKDKYSISFPVQSKDQQQDTKQEVRQNNIQSISLYCNSLQKICDKFYQSKISIKKVRSKTNQIFKTEKEVKQKSCLWFQEEAQISNLSNFPFPRGENQSISKFLVKEETTPSELVHEKNIQSLQQSLELTNKRVFRKTTSHLHYRKYPDQIKDQTAASFALKRRSQVAESHFIFPMNSWKDQNSNAKCSKSKILYYKDFLWKIIFNQGFRYEKIEKPVFKYYLGRGNNSKLIRKIISKRFWWVEETDAEKADFIWTQLKIYEIYNFQQNQCKNTKIQSVDENLKMKECFINEEEVQAVNSLNYGLCKQQDKNQWVLNREKYPIWKQYLQKHSFTQKKADQAMNHRKQLNKQILVKQVKVPKMTNHLELSRCIGNKKALHKTMVRYFRLTMREDDKMYLPLTFHITAGLEDDEYLRFLNEYYVRSKQGETNWIVKPGEMSNRGNGIKFCGSLAEIKQMIKKKEVHSNGTLKTFLIQKYIEKPLLYQGRKFDLRHYMMISSIAGTIRAYFYQEGYVRTTSYKYNMKNGESCIHLTNDAVQKYCKEYGKYEAGNKLSYQDLDQYMLSINPKYRFYSHILPQIKAIVQDIAHAAFSSIDPHRKANNFEIFGIDIMIDANYKCWLIEVNTNPCLQLSCPILAEIIPKMINNAFTISIDPIFYPPELQHTKWMMKEENYLIENKFQLVFDQSIDGKHLTTLYSKEKTEQTFGDDDQKYQSCSDNNDD